MTLDVELFGVLKAGRTRAARRERHRRGQEGGCRAHVRQPSWRGRWRWWRRRGLPPGLVAPPPPPPSAALYEALAAVGVGDSVVLLRELGLGSKQLVDDGRRPWD